MSDEIPPPPAVPTRTESASPSVRVWYYAGPVVLDALALICTTVLVAMKILPVEDFKYLVGILVVGNVALRIPGGKPGAPPGGGGFIIALLASTITAMRGFRT